MKRTRAQASLFMIFSLLSISLLPGCGGGAINNSGGGGGGTPPSIPTLTAIAPSNAAVGAPAITFGLFGSNFVNGATVKWNNATLISTWVSATNLTATIPASDLAAVGSAQVTVTNPGSGGGTSAAQTFKVVAAPAQTTWVRTVAGITPGNTPPSAQNIVWDAARGRLYYALPSTAATNPNTIAVIDPIAGAVTANIAAGNSPDELAISSDSSYLWAGLDGSSLVQRFLLPGFAKDISFLIPPDSSGNAQQALTLQAAPGSPHTMALIAGRWNEGSNGNPVYVYDDATLRPTSYPGQPNLVWLQWGANASRIYGLADVGSADDVLLTLNVTLAGVSLESAMGGGPYRTLYPVYTQVYSQFDGLNGLLYSYGVAFNTADGSQVGNFNTAPAPYDTPFGWQACTSDPSLGRYYCVEEGPVEYVLWVFDLNRYALIDLVSLSPGAGYQNPTITGNPQNLVRWGNAGLALTTDTYSGFGSGGFFLIDGAAINPNAAADVSSGAPAPPYSWVATLTPQQVPAGSADVAVTINGRNFTPESTACWNCAHLGSEFLPTFYVSSQQLIATIPASLLGSPAAALINIYDTGTNLYSTDTLTFTITPTSVSGAITQVSAINMSAFAMAPDPISGLLYVGTTDFDSANPNAIVAVSGEAGNVVKTQNVGTDPWTLSVSANGQYLYAGYYYATTITQLPLPGLQPPLTWAVTEPLPPGVNYALDIQAAPVDPHTIAVENWGFNVVIYDDSVPRPDSLNGSNNGTPGFEAYTTLAWGATDEVLAGTGPSGKIAGLQITPSGVVFNAQGSDSSFNACGGEIHSDFKTGLIYSDCGNVANPTTLATVGTYNASGLVAPDSSLNRVFILRQTAAQANTSNYTIESFDEKAYTPVSSITLNNLMGYPIQLVRWGTSGLAVLTFRDPENSMPGMLYLIQDTTFVSNVQADVSELSKSHELVQQRWTRLSKADIAKIVHP